MNPTELLASLALVIAQQAARINALEGELAQLRQQQAAPSVAANPAVT